MKVTVIKDIIKELLRKYSFALVSAFNARARKARVSFSIGMQIAIYDARTQLFHATMFLTSYYPRILLILFNFHESWPLIESFLRKDCMKDSLNYYKLFARNWSTLCV